jgi:hypothetical protein
VSKSEKIRLPLRQEDGAIVLHTLNGQWLVGFGYQKGTPAIGPQASEDEQKQWGRGKWFVIRSASGKLVVYKTDRDERPVVHIYESFEAMQPTVPPSIYDEAMVKAGLRQPPQFPEVPLEGV